MAKARGYVGWALPPDERARLLVAFPPAYATAVAHHVTLAFNVPAGVALPTARAGRIVGESDDGAGVQALVVEIDGAIERPDGSIYHVTWSLGPGRRPAEANDVVRGRRWRGIEPAAVRLTPRFFPFQRRR